MTLQHILKATHQYLVRAQFMWILSLLYNEVTTYRALRLNSSMRVGRNHDYKKDPTCLYIPDLKVPKTYITIKVGEQAEAENQVTPLSVTFESICTTDVNGTILKLPRKDAEPFERSFTEHDLLFKVNANKSDRIKIRIRWIPIVALPFSKKIQFEGVVQQSPLPKAIADLKEAGLDVRMTNDPFLATHYVALTGSLDYNLQIAVSRALPIVSSKWCEFLTNFSDDVDSWLFTVRPDLYIHDVEGVGIFPNEARTSLLKGEKVHILADSVDSKPVRRLRDWLVCLSAEEVSIDNIRELSSQKLELANYISNLDSLVFCVETGPSAESSSIKNIANTSSGLWDAVVAVDIQKLKRSNAEPTEILSSDKRDLDKEPTPISQRRKRRKLERVEDTNFFSFSPLSSNKPEPESEPKPTNAAGLEDPRDGMLSRSGSPQSQSQTQFQTAQINEDGIERQNDMDEPNERNESIALVEDERASQNSVTISPEEDSTRSVTDVIPKPQNITTNDEKVDKEKPKKAKSWIVPEVSLAEAFIAVKQKAAQSIKEELGIGQTIEEDLGKRLVIEEFELRPPPVKQTSESNGLYRNRKNFKAFRKVGPKQNNITRTFIELVDNGNAVYFTDEAHKSHAQDPKSRGQNGQNVAGDFESEMDGVRGYQPEPSQLFVGDASESDSDNQEDGFQFSERRTNDDSASASTSGRNRSENQMDVDSDSSEDSDSDSDGEVRFAFTRRS